MTPLQKHISNFFFSFLSLGALSLLLVSPAWAAVGVTTAELQEARDIILPQGNGLESLEGFSHFSLQSKVNISGGVLADYEARLSQDPWQDSELPHLQIFVTAYEDQAAAQFAFTTLNASQVLFEDERNLVYQSNGGNKVDVFNTVNAEYLSFHHVQVNGNLIFQVSLYRPDEAFNQKTSEQYVKAVADPSQALGILSDAIETMKLALGIVFPPSGVELSTKSEKSSLNLSELYEVPLHGRIGMQLYIGEPNGAVGTLLDSSGISTAEEGDIYLFVNSDGRLFAGLYAPDFDSNCPQQSGWYRIESTRSLHAYEWNEVALNFGVGGFYIELNGQVDGACSVAQARSEGDLYFGDFPGDGISESMIGSVKELRFLPRLTNSGLRWDDVLTNQLFLDLPNTDPDVPVFQFLKEEGIFVGSDGLLYPDHYLNRAEMVKILLRAFDYVASDGGSVPFWDVPSDAWYLKYLAKATQIGMIEGNPDGSFLGANTINHAEFYTMLSRVDKGKKLSYKNEFDDVVGGEWYLAGAAYAAREALLDGPLFDPEHRLTRREAAQALYTLLQ